MPVIAVVNRKGGSGKSTLATHLAAWCAHAGIPVMLGDVDRQQSTQTWLRLREAHGLKSRAPLVGWAVDPKRVLRPPAGVNHVILDTPGGVHGFDLARMVMCADAILMPVCNSVFDRQSSADCHAELMALPRVAGGKCRVAAVGMRLDARTRAEEVLAAWAADRGLPFLGALRETQAYVRCIEQGLTVFDLPESKSGADRTQWQPIFDWLEPVLHAAARQGADEARPATASRHEQRPAGPTSTASTVATTTVPAPTVARTTTAAPEGIPRQAIASGTRPTPQTSSPLGVDSLPAARPGAKAPDSAGPRPSVAARIASVLFARLPRVRQRQA